MDGMSISLHGGASLINGPMTRCVRAGLGPPALPAQILSSKETPCATRVPQA
jgi:hypothetical protein